MYLFHFYLLCNDKAYMDTLEILVNQDIHESQVNFPEDGCPERFQSEDAPWGRASVSRSPAGVGDESLEVSC